MVQPPAAIQITAHPFTPMFSAGPTFIVDGEEVRWKWREPYVFPVTPGTHTVKVFCRYPLPREAGRIERTFEVPAGVMLQLDYKPPQFVFMTGNLATPVPAPSPPPRPPSGWYPDPTGHYPLRYWTGTDWGEWVAKDGVEGQDPFPDESR